ncbi:cellulose biosynthesis protein BcsS [Rhodoplanes roseus]|nr:cellulose biosynthesis protein BcsS [Rhodoplanes roseus]
MPAASAQPAATAPVSADLLATLEAERLLLFGGTDFWRAGGFLHGGFAWAPDGLAHDGPVFKVLAGAGTYQYRVGRTPIEAAQTLLSVTPGWIFRRDRFIAVVHGGIDLQDQWTLPVDPGNPLRGPHAGMRLGLETWWEPLQDVMVKSHATWSSTGHGWGAGAAAGYRMLQTWYGGLFVGPEVQAYGDATYHQLRAGLHGTALQYGPYQWSAGMGWVTDSDHRSGLYVRIGVLTKM